MSKGPPHNFQFARQKNTNSFKLSGLGSRCTKRRARAHLLHYILYHSIFITKYIHRRFHASSLRPFHSSPLAICHITLLPITPPPRRHPCTRPQPPVSIYHRVYLSHVFSDQHQHNDHGGSGENSWDAIARRPTNSVGVLCCVLAAAMRPVLRAAKGKGLGSQAPQQSPGRALIQTTTTIRPDATPSSLPLHTTPNTPGRE